MAERDRKTQRILVTGAAGFVGFHLIERLLKSGAVVHGLDNLNSYYDVNLKKARLAEIGKQERFSFSALDVVDYDDLQALFATFGPDHVVHLAAQAGVRHSITNPRAYARSNLDGFVSVLEACRVNPVKHLIYASSSSVYGIGASVPYREDDPAVAPVSLYAATKRANELIAQAYAHLYGIPCSGVRFFTLYGPWGRPDMAYYSFAEAIVEGRPIDVFNNGQLQRDFTYIDDAVEALVRLIDLPPNDAARAINPTRAPHIIYNIGNSKPVALEHFITVLESALGRRAIKRRVPMQPGDVLTTCADIERLYQATGFVPSTPIEIGIARFVDWFRSYHSRSADFHSDDI